MQVQILRIKQWALVAIATMVSGSLVGQRDEEDGDDDSFAAQKGYIGYVNSNGDFIPAGSTASSDPVEFPVVTTVSGKTLVVPDPNSVGSDRTMQADTIAPYTTGLRISGSWGHAMLPDIVTPTIGYFVLRWMGDAIVNVESYKIGYNQFDPQWYAHTHMGYLYHYARTDEEHYGNMFYWLTMRSTMVFYPQTGDHDNTYFAWLFDFPVKDEGQGANNGSWVMMGPQSGLSQINLDENGSKKHWVSDWQSPSGYICVFSPHEPDSPAPAWYWFQEIEGITWMYNVTLHGDTPPNEAWISFGLEPK